jgi:uncharacterized protein involved in response to NO
MTDIQQATTRRRGGIPRGLLDTGPILLSYGFRPFFLGAALWACGAMVLWLTALGGLLPVAGQYGALAWHTHEMLFGFASAVLAGFLLTAVPNWTGRLPVSGSPLFYLFLLWLAGRIALLASDIVGPTAAAAVDSLFLPVLLAICVREVVAGRKWADLKVIAGLGALSIANLCFHYETLMAGAPDRSIRLATSAYVLLIIVVGGRILPSFTRNWLNRFGRTDFPVPYNKFDLATILYSVVAFALWIVAPDAEVTGLVAAGAAVLHLIRLARWRGWTTLAEPLVAVLHVAYAFVSLGFLAISASAFGVMDGPSALHVLTVGTITTMMIAVMTRATRGHTGRELTASRTTLVTYAAIVLCALARPLTAFAPEHASGIHALAGSLWFLAFAAFVLEYAPMLITKRRAPAR